jgi:hypothetical protein
MTKAQKQDRLIKHAINNLNQIGAIDTNIISCHSTRYELKTIYGKLRISLSKDDLRRGKEPTITVFAQFDDHELAKKNIKEVGFTGKYNHHFMNRYDLNWLILLHFEELKKDYVSIAHLQGDL